MQICKLGNRVNRLLLNVHDPGGGGTGHFNEMDIGVKAETSEPSTGAFGESEEKKSGGIGLEQGKMSQYYYNFPKFSDLSVKIDE